MFLVPVLLILTGLVITGAGVGFGSWTSRRPRAIGRAGRRQRAVRVAFSVMPVLGSISVVLGIAEGFIGLVAGV